MKKQIAFMIIALLTIASCKKDDFYERNKPIYPDPPAEVVVFYHVYVHSSALYPSWDTISHDTYTRKITFVSDWYDSAGIAMPFFKDTVVTGDLYLTFTMKTHRQKAYDNFFNYVIPVNVGWEATDGKLSLTKVEAGAIRDVKEVCCYSASGGCPDNNRPLRHELVYYYCPGINDIGIYNR